MFWFILGVIGFIVNVIFIFCDGNLYFIEKMGWSLLSLFCVFFVAGLCFTVSSAIASDCAETDYYMVEDTQIVALKDNQNVYGEHYIFSSQIDEDLYYYYAIETKDGYKVEKVEAENCYIKYTDGETHIEKHEGRFTNKVVNFFATPNPFNQYVIYCPENTITTEFNIDLE